MSSSESESEQEPHDESEMEEESDGEQSSKIREDLSTMTFEEIMKLKEELGSKLYNEAMFGAGSSGKKGSTKKKETTEFKRLNKNRPREASAKKQVPFLGAELRMEKKNIEQSVRDPRFDEASGSYDTKQFKENYKFITRVRHKEVSQLRKQLEQTTDNEEKTNIKRAIQRLVNKNVEDIKWHRKQAMLKKEQQEMQKARAEGKQPHYLTKKERQAKELIMQFEHLKKTGKLNKHLEKRRKKNAAKDRKVLNFD